MIWWKLYKLLNILLKGVTKTIENETKEQKGGFLSVIRNPRWKFIRKFIDWKRNWKSCFWSSFVLCFAKTIGFLIPPHPLTNFEIQKYYENKSRFNGVYSRNNLPKKIKDGAYVINLDEFILIVLELNIFLKKLKRLLVIKT